MLFLYTKNKEAKHCATSYVIWKFWPKFNLHCVSKTAQLWNGIARNCNDRLSNRTQRLGRQHASPTQWFTNQRLIWCSLQVRRRYHETLGKTLRRCLESASQPAMSGARWCRKYHIARRRHRGQRTQSRWSPVRYTETEERSCCWGWRHSTGIIKMCHRSGQYRALHGLFCTVWKSGKVPAEWKGPGLSAAITDQSPFFSSRQGIFTCSTRLTWQIKSFISHNNMK